MNRVLADVRLAGGLLLGLAGCVLLALLVGQYPLVPGDLLSAWHGQVSESAVVLWNLRLPRILAALLIGACLAGAGTAYQGMFRNPLVSPDILGVSAGAGLGAVLGIFFSLSLLWVQLLAFLAGCWLFYWSICWRSKSVAMTRYWCWFWPGWR